MKNIKQRVAARYLQGSISGDLRWGTDQIAAALNILDEVATVWTLRRPGHPAEGREAPADIYREVAHAVQDIQGPISKKLSDHLKAIRRISRSRPRTAKRYRHRRLDPKLRRIIHQVFWKEGLDGRKNFRKPEDGYRKAVDILDDYGIELDGIISGWVFRQPEGRFDVELAYKNKDDPFSPIQISNSMLIMSFYKRDKDKFEVLAYLS